MTASESTPYIEKYTIICSLCFLKMNTVSLKVHLTLQPSLSWKRLYMSNKADAGGNICALLISGLQRSAVSATKVTR